jgi:hypothetical protein
MDSSKPGNADTRIDLRRIEVLMSEKFLDVPNVGAILQHVRCSGMPKQVTRAGLAQPGCCDIAAYKRGQLLALQGRAPGANEQSPLLSSAREMWSRSIAVCV